MNDEDNGRITMQAPPMGVSNTGTVQPSVAIPKHVMWTAIRHAEKGVDEINSLLRDAEQERNDLVRRLSAQQDRVDALTGEREHLSRHVRDLRAANH